VVGASLLAHHLFAIINIKAIIISKPGGDMSDPSQFLKDRASKTA